MGSVKQDTHIKAFSSTNKAASVAHSVREDLLDSLNSDGWT